MAQDYTEWLAINVLNEQQNVNYRNLSRALKVHANLAKQMLYDFHHKQNSKKPGSVHATYLITGTKRPVQTNGVHSQEDGEDTVMRSSPPLPSSSIPQPENDAPGATPTRSIMLVKEQHLDQAKDLFETMTSIHIYSLQINGLNDFQPLTDCNRRVAAEYASEDPLKEWKKYGVVQNPSVKRRTRKTGPPPAAVPAAKPEPIKAKTAASAAAKTSAAEIKETARPSSKGSGAHAQPEGTSKPAAGKKDASNIFKSFAKGAAKPKKTDSQQNPAAASPAPPSAAEPDDVPMTGFSDDDMDDDAGSGLPEEEVEAPSGKSKKEREAELQAMMDAEDEPMEDAATPAADEEKHDEGAIDKAESQPKEEPKETVTVENGRRRGKRRVMKKKTVKDEEGYLVTREEAAWESFSEDEPAPKKPKVQAPATNKPSAGKKGAKAGQGNIMSFFSKN